jgi:uncharacterized membrane protein YfcA
MLFTTSGVDISPWVPPLVAFAVSFATSMGGVSGAFLLLPFQMSFLGYTAPSVSATNQLYNIVAIPSGVYRYLREGRMVWPLTWVVILGTLPGVLLGAFARIAYLPDPKNFKLFVACVLLYIGSRMARDLSHGSTGDAKRKSEARFQELVQQHREAGTARRSTLPAVRVVHFSLRRIEYEFYGEQFGFSTMAIFALSLVVGVIGGVYGIGGGAIIAPFFVTFFGLPIYTVSGAALMGTFVTSVAGVIFYQAIAPFYPDISVAPDWGLGILFGIGGMAGMYFGARCQKFVPARVIKSMLCCVILFTALKYMIEFFF